MTAKQVIDYISELDPNEELIISWWSKGYENLTNEEWSEVVWRADDINWSDINEQIDYIVDECRTLTDEDEV